MLSERSGGRRACAFYATDDAYALAALVAVEQLHRLGRDPTTEMVLLHYGVGRPLLEVFAARGVRLIAQAPFPVVRHHTYRHCFIKLRVLDLTEYERLVFLDADGLPMRPVEELLDREQERPIAASRAYWLPVPMFSTMLLVVRPAAELWRRVDAALPEAAARGEPDMDLLNRILEDEVEHLPEGAVCIDSEFVDRNGPTQFGEPEATYARMAYVHFSGAGKPWFRRPERMRRVLPDAHPVFHRIWSTWWALRDEVRPETAWQVLRRHALYDLQLARVGRVALRTGLALGNRIR